MDQINLKKNIYIKLNLDITKNKRKHLNCVYVGLYNYNQSVKKKPYKLYSHI